MYFRSDLNEWKETNFAAKMNSNSNQIRRINETKNLTGEAKDKTVPQIEQLKETAKNAELKQQIKWDGHLIRARVAQFANGCLQKGWKEVEGVES